MIDFIKILITISFILIGFYILVIYFVTVFPYAILLGIIIMILANVFNKK